MEKIKEIWAKYPHYVFVGGLVLFVVIVFIATSVKPHGSQKNYIPANKPAVQQQQAQQQQKPAVEPLASGPVELVALAHNPVPDLAGSLYVKGIWIKPKDWEIYQVGDNKYSAAAVFPVLKKFDKATFSLGQERPEKNLTKYVPYVNIEIYTDEKKVWEKKINRDKPITSDIPVEIDLRDVSTMTVRLAAPNKKEIHDWYNYVPGFVFGNLEFTPKPAPEEAK